MNREDIVAKIKLFDLPERNKLITLMTDKVDEWYGGKRRNSGEPFGDHPREVVSLLLDLYPIPVYVLYTGGGHDGIELGITEAEIKKYVGLQAFQLIDGLTEDRVRLVSADDSSESYSDIEYRVRKVRYHRKFETFWGCNPFLLITKFPDSLHNLRTIQYLEPARKRLLYIQEAQWFIDFYEDHVHEMRRMLCSTQQIATIETLWIQEMKEIINRIILEGQEVAVG